MLGYVKCKKDAGKKIKTFAGNFLGRQILSQVTSNNHLDGQLPSNYHLSYVSQKESICDKPMTVWGDHIYSRLNFIYILWTAFGRFSG